MHGKKEGEVGSGTQSKPDIRLGRGRRKQGIDDDELGAPLLRVENFSGDRGMRVENIVAHQKNKIRLVVIDFRVLPFAAQVGGQAGTASAVAADMARTPMVGAPLKRL